MFAIWKRLLSLLLVLAVLAPLTLHAAAFAEEEEDELMLEEDIVLDDEEEVAFIIGDGKEVTEEDLEALEIDDSINPDDLEINPELPGNVINILLIGVDSRETNLQSTTSLLHNDVTMILSVNMDNGAIKLTSILRDLYTSIPGYKDKGRLNVAFARGAGKAGNISGGASLTMRTIHPLFKMNISQYAVINFYGVAEIIEQLGGIDLMLTRGEAYAINYYLEKNGSKMKYDTKGNDNREKLTLPKGNKDEEMELRHLDGMQALMYARLRTGMKERTGDFWRTNRQRYLLETLLKKVLNGMDLNKLGNLIQVAYPYVQTNIPAGTILQLAVSVISQGNLMEKMNSGESMIEQLSIPMDKHYSYDQVDGASVITMTSAQWADAKDRIHYFIYGESD